MEEKENTDVQSQEVVNPENSQTSEASQNENSDSHAQPKEGTKEYNWRRLEEQKQQLEQKYNLLEEKFNKVLETKKEPEESEPQLQEDDLITYGQLDKLAEKKAREIFQQENLKAEREKQPLAAKNKYTDFEQVVSPENIEKLEKENPELARLITLSNNPFEMTYKEIKRSKFYQDRIKTKENDEKIDANSQKPTSVNSLGKQRPLSHANNFAKGDPTLWDEMQKCRGGFI